MACTNCTDNQNTGFYPNTSGCVNCPSPCPDGCDPKDASCILYTGAPLNCVGTPSNTNLEVILQNIDSKLCSATGDFSGFNFYCLINQGPINTEKQFVEKISQFVCETRTALDTFTNTTYTSGIASLQTQINVLSAPGITSCTELSIVPADNQKTVLTKLANALCSMYGALNPSSANWSQCFTLVGAPPATIVEGFNTILSQICQIKTSGGGATPTFDNTGSCLSSPTATDSLVDTISKIKTRLCATPTFNANNLGSFSCIQFSPNASLETVLVSAFNQVNTISIGSIRDVTSDFVLTNIDNSAPCLGKRLALNLTNIDRKVASNSSDPTPGTLADKLQAGTNVTIDFTTTPGKVILSASGGTSVDEKVKVNSVDTTAGFLQQKVIGSTDTISISITPYNNDTQLRFSANIDTAALVDLLLDGIAENEEMKTKFCSLISSCPSPCDAPTNVQIIPA